VKKLLIGIFLFALFLRTYKLTEFPVGFHGDEANVGYNAYSLLKTGKDKNGVFLPLSIDQWGDFRPAGYHYLAIIPTALLGVSELAVRLPAAIFGALSVIFLFLLIKELFGDEKTALIGATLLAISPWHINTSRSTSESIIALFLVIAGTYLFLKGIKSSKFSLILAYTCFIFSLFFYHAARFFIPVWLLFLTAISLFFNKTPEPKIKKFLLLGGLFFFVIFIIIFIFSRGTSRPLDISIFNNQETQLILEEQIREDGGANVIFTRAFHNKIIAYLLTFFNNYLRHFSGDFLFIKGGLPPRYIIPWSGNLYPVELPFLVLGLSLLISALFKERKFLLSLPLVWLLLGPIPAALTYEDIPNIQRSLMTIPAFIIIIAYGINALLQLINLKILKILLSILIAFLFAYNLMGFMHNYFHHSLTHQPWYRNAGEKELTNLVKKYSEQNYQFIMSAHGDNNLIFYLFYLKIDPKYYQDLGSPRDKDGLRFQNLLFLNKDCPAKDVVEEKLPTNDKTLYVNQGTCPVMKNYQILQIIKRPDGTPAFQVVRIKASQPTDKEN